MGETAPFLAFCQLQRFLCEIITSPETFIHILGIEIEEKDSKRFPEKDIFCKETHMNSREFNVLQKAK